MAADGVVAVQGTEGLMPFARHSVGFTTWGTAVRVGAYGHRTIGPEVALRRPEPDHSRERSRGALQEVASPTPGRGRGMWNRGNGVLL
jgi:hypothetical protein